MCLDKVQKFRVRKDLKEKEYYAWKIFILNSTGLRSPYFAKKIYRLENVWLKSHNRQLYYNNVFNSYTSGFHCYLTKRDALIEKSEIWDLDDNTNTIIKKVLLRKIITTGLQSSKRVVVAKEIYIPSQV